MAEGKTRLHVDDDLAGGGDIACAPEQARYLLGVLRLGAGDALLVFNGRDGEWRATIAQASKRGCTLSIVARTRPQANGQDIDLLFAPLKRARLDYMVQKATELGVARLTPVITRRTNVERVNRERMRANAIEAAEQCGILNVPEIDRDIALETVIETWDARRRIVLADEAAKRASPIAALAGLGPGPLAVLVGPEGGFAPEERARLLALPFVTPISLGPRIMRADTAAVAALALVNAVLGDWR